MSDQAVASGWLTVVDAGLHAKRGDRFIIHGSELIGR